eukprot:TRINITY_DN18384_c0_g1_i1.p1 TRINITY_DN18384_c0_g1~~TRINITY_DN18384_c0_g1_i1.p1  ORF type:complete len:416 (+),score=167.61 TRINITY_DN18384_c0_g1_i1:86-1249(+)
MKITMKNVGSSDPKIVDIADDATVGDLMQKYGDDFKYDVKALAFKGRNMKDRSAKLVEVGIVENEVCVVVGTKRKEEAKAAAPATTSAPAEPASAPAPKAEEKKQEAPADVSTAAATAAGAFLTGDAVDETITMIMQMGDWNPDQVRAALRAAFNNPDRAVELLFSGQIPQNPEPAPSAAPPATGGAPAATPAPAAPAATGAAPASGGAGGPVQIPGLGTLTAEQFQEIIGVLSRTNATVNPAAVVEFLQRFGGQPPAGAGGAELSPLAQRLSQIREWNTIRQAVANDRTALESVIQALRDKDPELFQLIQNNQQEFFRLIQEGIPGQPAAPPGTRTVTLTPQDRQAIDRLVQLGFSQDAAVQAYVMADRNEEMAANLLFDSGMDED